MKSLILKIESLYNKWQYILFLYILLFIVTISYVYVVCLLIYIYLIRHKINFKTIMFFIFVFLLSFIYINTSKNKVDTNFSDSCDYSDFGYRAAKEVSLGNVDYGIVICSTGIGISIAANKVNGIRCGLVDNVEFAALTREHNNANMLAMGAKAVDAELAKKIVDTFLTTPFSNGPRHIRRIEKISKYEKEERNNG